MIDISIIFFLCVQKFLKNYIRIPKIIEYGNCYMNDKNISYIVMEKLGPDLTNLNNQQAD